jgi:hypothetical protein
LSSIHREAAQKEEVVSNQRVFEEFLLGHKVEEWLEGKADDRDIGPVLMLGENDHRSMIRKRCFPLCLDPIKNGEDTLGHLFGCGVDKGIPFHCYKPLSKAKCKKNFQFRTTKILEFVYSDFVLKFVI